MSRNYKFRNPEEGLETTRRDSCGSGGEDVKKVSKYEDTWNVYYNNKLINKFND